MAKNKGNEQKKEETKKTSSTIIELATILSGEKGKEIKDALDQSGIIEWWQRDPNESITSARNVLKALGVIGTYGAYYHLDPFPDSKMDNVAVTAVGFVMLGLLAVPQRNELGARFPGFEAKIMKAVIGSKPEEIAEIMTWVRKLSNMQEGRLAALFAEYKSEEDYKKIAEILKNEEVRATLKECLGKEPTPEDIMSRAKGLVEKWPLVKKQLSLFDTYVAVQLIDLRTTLNGIGVRKRRRVVREAILYIPRIIGSVITAPGKATMGILNIFRKNKTAEEVSVTEEEKICYKKDGEKTEDTYEKKTTWSRKGSEKGAR